MTVSKPEPTALERCTFDETFRYKLIYAYTIDDSKHEGFVKVGDTEVVSRLPPDRLSPNCKTLNDAARQRIDQQTQTAGVEYTLLYTELAVRYRIIGRMKVLEHFGDGKVHAVLKNSGLPHRYIGNTKGREWFEAGVKDIKAAIAAVKDCRSVIAGGEMEHDEPIVFRDEQRDAIDRTLACFRKKNEMLWDAKMRFGKTLTALEVVRESRGRFRRVIIVTHRPVVGSGWQEDFNKLFTREDGYTFYHKASLGGDYEFNGKDEDQNDRRLREMDRSGERFVYFASIQDLRGSQMAGGKYDKNRGVFKLDWDLVIIDEAHEGTQTELGQDVRQLLVKARTKVLSLSGTPFNIMAQYDEDAVFVWDYVMEQDRKDTWEEDHPDEPNPYAALPRLNIYTYDIGNEFSDFSDEDLDGKAFNFREFFRTWTGDRDVDGRNVPSGSKVGDFVYEDAVRRFLDLISGDSATSRYPFATQEHRDLFRHTLWMVPGVASAKALSSMLRKHRYFRNYGIANVAGEGDDYEERHFDSALELVKKTIRDNGYSITLSCGKLTTGVTVPEWTAVLMVAGSAVASASQYMQTIFRVQSPGNLGGKMKTNCYAFDFAPDRALKVLAETAQVSRRFNKNTAKEATARQYLDKFLNFCPVISISGSRMVPYDVKRMMANIKHIFVMRAIRNGFDDSALYSGKLLELTDIDLRKFEDLRSIVGSTKQTKMADTVYVNQNDFDEEEHERKGDRPKRELTPEEKAARDERRRRQEERRNAILILRAISIRMPLLIYGADVPIEKVISISEFPRFVDDESWAEFMPAGVTKEIFRKFVEYYDADVFAEAGTQIRKIAKSADRLPPTRRMQQIVRIFSYFKNPDKETVLTPWRVVNMHLAETLGGWCFYDSDFEKPLEDAPRLVSHEGVTQRVFGKPDTKVLEVNSKSGLYPLYVAYSLYRRRLGDVREDAVKPTELAKLWREVVARSVFVVCKTPMAAAITRRTLIGYDEKATVNTQYIPNLVEMLKAAPKKFYDKVCGGNAWKNKEFEMKMLKFDAVVGNPPYQIEVAKKQSETNGQAPRTSIFQFFQMAADAVSSGFTSLIYPGARWMHRSGKGMAEFGLKQINDPHLSELHFWADASDLFPGAVAIADGISMVLKDMRKTTPGFRYVYHAYGEAYSCDLKNPGEELIPLDPRDGKIIAKVRSFCESRGLCRLNEKVYPRTLFGIESDFVENNPACVKPYESGRQADWSRMAKLLANDRAGKGGRSRWYLIRRSDIPENSESIDLWKVVVSSANAGGQKRDWQLELLDNHSAFGRSRVALGMFKTRSEAENFLKYCQSYLIRFLFLMTDEALTTLAKEVPFFGDWKTAGGMIDFDNDVNSQLCALIKLSKAESAYVVKTIRDLDNSRSIGD